MASGISLKRVDTSKWSQQGCISNRNAENAEHVCFSAGQTVSPVTTTASGEKLGHSRRDLPQFSDDTENMKNGRAFIVKSELSGSMGIGDFEYEIAVTSVRNRRFMLVHSLENPNRKRGEFS